MFLSDTIRMNLCQLAQSEVMFSLTTFYGLTVDRMLNLHDTSFT